MSEETVKEFGKNVPMKRRAQPTELATAYVMLADPLSSYVSGATIAVTGGKPILDRLPTEPNFRPALKSPPAPGSSIPDSLFDGFTDGIRHNGSPGS
jgi:Enoyl-(Acyl carrier protein) reductase